MPGLLTVQWFYRIGGAGGTVGEVGVGAVIGLTGVVATRDT